MSCAVWPPRLTNDEWFAGDGSGHESVIELAGIVMNDADAAAGTDTTTGTDTDTNTATSSAVVAFPTRLVGAGGQLPAKVLLAPRSPPSSLCRQ